MKKWFLNQRIGGRILIGFAVVLVFMGVVGTSGLLGLRSVQTSYSTAYTDSVEVLRDMETLGSAFERERMGVYRYVLAQSPSDKALYKQQLMDEAKAVDGAIRAYQQLLTGYAASEIVQEAALLDALEKEHAAYVSQRDEFLSGAASDPAKRDAAFAQITAEGGLAGQALIVSNATQKLMDYNVAYAQQQIELNNSRSTVASIVILLFMVSSIAFSIMIGLYVSRSISRPVKNLVTVANQLALGDVEVEVTVTTKDEIGELYTAFAGMVASIRDQAHIAQQMASGDLTVDVTVRSAKDLLGQKLDEMVTSNNTLFSAIAAAAAQVGDGAIQLSGASQNLAHGSGEQASSIEQISASMEEIGQQTRQNATAADEASTVVTTAMERAQAGDERMQKMLLAMEQINHASANISRIIRTIDDISFQTNILALNAAVEAARAGAAGKGFAVVADEVRTLAGKAASAAKETTAMIEDSIQKVEAGTKLAHETAAILRQIVDNASKSAQLVHGIAVASGQQSAGIDQIRMAVEHVTDVVQTNSATSEETASVSEELAAQAEELKAVVAQVRLKAGEHGTSADAALHYQSAASHGFAPRDIAPLSAMGAGKY